MNEQATARIATSSNTAPKSRPAATITASTGSAYSRILSTGSYRPSRIVTNAEICEHIDSSDEWIRARSGIIERRFAADNESVVDMGTAAAVAAVANANITPDQVGAVIVGTVTHPYQTPSAAAEIAERLGTRGAGAVDLSAACAGFSYGVGFADGIIRSGAATYVVVIGVEKLSDFTSPHDRSTAFIFADGAGAAVIGPSDEVSIGPTVWGSDGSQCALIMLEPDWVTYRKQLESSDDDDVIAFPSLHMQGQAVFRWAVGEVSKVARQALDAAGVTVDDLDAFIPHQANMRITDAMVRTLGLPSHVAVARDIETSGNTSAASIPLAMDRMLHSGEVKSGDLALLIGFGAGLAYAAQVVRLP